MKHKFITLVLSLFVLAFTANAQEDKSGGKSFNPKAGTAILSEDFEGGVLPAGWTVLNGEDYRKHCNLSM